MPETPHVGHTQEHDGPARPAAADRVEAWLVAFPRPAVLAPPPSGQPVGRDWLASVGTVDGLASAQHLVVTRAGGFPHLADVGSRNGTWVDGQRLSPGERVQIADGAVVRIGTTLLVYRTDLAATPVARAPLGDLVGPFGLAAVTSTLDSLGRAATRNVLIEGETGTGKELLAREVARAFGRERRYAAVNVASVPAGVFEAQLFGYVAGAYSGSGKGARGIVAAHDGGAVFLDEIGELALDLQPKLLRLLENREVLPVGADRASRVDVLLVAATNRSLDELVEAGTFRRDLLARFASSRLELPPLRERPEDVPSIALALAARQGWPTGGAFEIEAMERLALHAWPANVRELDAVLERVRRVDASGALRLWALDRVLGPATQQPRGALLTQQTAAAALALCGGNETQAARRLGVSRGKLRRFLLASRDS